MNTWRTYLATAFIALMLAGLLLIAGNAVPFARDINVKGRDHFFRLHHLLSSHPPEKNDLLLVKVDDETLRHLESRWPYPRSLYAEALKILKPLQPKAVGFDLVFSGNDFSPESDARFGEALKEAGNVIIAGLEGDDGPPPLIRQNVSQIGMVGKPRDRDRLIRRTRLSFPVQGSQYPSWEWALFRKASPEKEVPPVPEVSKVVIDYRLRFNEFPQISFWHLLEEGSTLANEVKNKIVLVGLTAEVFHDIHATPLGSMPGLAVNANVLMMLMSGGFFSFAPQWVTAALAFLSLWLALLLALFSPFGLAFFVILCLVPIYFAISFLLFTAHVILDLWLVGVGMITTLIGTVVLRQGQLSIENLKLKEESVRDPLTGFYNRRFLVLKLKSEFHRLFSKRSWFKSDVDISVVMLDLDNFKLVNDSFGHAEGDRVLRIMGQAIRSSVRENELICRYGGDEFCVLLPNTSLANAVKFAEKICKLIASHSDLTYRTADGVDSIRVTASIGVACVSGIKGGIEPDKLLKAADRALYRAKSGGRNQVCIYDSTHDEIK